MRYSTTSRVPYTPVTPQGPPHKIDSHFGEYYDIHDSAPFGGSGFRLSRICKIDLLAGGEGTLFSIEGVLPCPIWPVVCILLRLFLNYPYMAMLLYKNAICKVSTQALKCSFMWGVKTVEWTNAA